MEMQQAIVPSMLEQTIKNSPEKLTKSKPLKQRWRITFHRSSTTKSNSKSKEIPKEFLCPVSGLLMAEPVIVSSGHTFERACVEACKSLGFVPSTGDSTVPDFSTVIPNLALKTMITKWCETQFVNFPKPLDFSSAERIVKGKMEENGVVSVRALIEGVEVNLNPNFNFNHAVTELTRRPSRFYSNTDPQATPLHLTTRSSCFSSSSSSFSSCESETLNLNPNHEEEEFVAKLNSQVVHEVEEAVISLRKITRTRQETRISLCSTRLLSALRSLITSRYTTIQINSVAALVNLSLAKINKVKIVRSGFVPYLIDVLKSGSSESQEHACGALFSLALDDLNKTAIGVLGALQPLFHLLRSESERTRSDSALALYHLTLVRSNRTKLVKFGSVPGLLSMVKSGHMLTRILLILGNLACCPVGRAAVLDSGGVECMVDMLKNGTQLSESTLESCVTVLFGLSHGGLRFKGLAKVAGVEEVLRRTERAAGEAARVKMRRILETMKARTESGGEEDVDWEDLLESGLTSRTRFRPGESNVNSSEF